MDNIFRVRDLAACFRTAQFLDEAGINEIVEDAKRSYCLLGENVPVEITNQDEENLLRNDIVGGIIARIHDLDRNSVEAATTRANEMLAHAQETGLIVKPVVAIPAP